MRLLRLELRRSPGIEKGFELEDLAPGLNLIVGPNGSGKSSLCRVLRATLWPQSERLPGAEAVSQWEAAGCHLRAELAGSVRWQRDGADCAAPSLPDPYRAAAYSLGLRDLLEVDGKDDKELVRLIQIQMAGGYDLAGLRSALRPKRNLGAEEEKEFQNTLRELRRLKEARSALAKEDDERAGLRGQIERARAAVARREGLGWARDLDRRRSELAAAEARRGSFAAEPEAMARLTGDERERLEQLELEQRDLEQKRDAAAQRLAQCEAEQAACGLPEGPLPRDEIATLSRNATHLLQRAGQLVELRPAVSAATAASERAWRMLAAEGLEGGRLAEIGVSELEELSARVERSFSLSEKRLALAAELSLAPAASGETAPPRMLPRAISLLEDWLEHPSAPAVGLGWVIRSALALAAVAGIAASLLPAISWPYGLLLAGFALGVVALDLWNGRRTGQGERAQRAAAFAALGIAGPVSWTASDVRERLAVLVQMQADASRRDRVRGQIAALDEQVAAAEAEQKSACLAIGCEPGRGPVTLADLLGRVRAWRTAEIEREAAQGRLDKLEQGFAAELADLRAALPPSVGSVATQPVAVAEKIEDLKARCERWRDAHVECEAARRDLANRVDQLAQLQQKWRRFFVVRAIAEGEPSQMRLELARRVAEWSDWQANEQQCVALSREVKGFETRLEGQPDLLELTSDAIEEQLAAAAASEESRGDLEQRLGDIDGRIREASQGSQLEEQRARVARAEAALAVRREQLMLDLAGDFLLESVESEYEQQSQPPVLQRASELFAGFTRHRYELRLAKGDGASFRAFDKQTGQGLALAQLSDGTRMQLLLAARLAFASEAEASHNRPPLLLDEALTASDPGRFEAVAGSLLELARDGRQIFYLTCNPADVACWQDICRKQAAADPRVIDLGELRRMQAGISEARHLRVAPRPLVPSPADLDAATYGARLRVPPPDGYAPAAALHLFHLLRGELPLLHRILSQAGVERVGEWRSLVAHGEARLHFAADECARVDAWVRVAEAFFDCWRVGRGLPVDRRVLAESGAVSEKFLEGLSAIAAEHAGDARALLEVLGDRGRREPRCSGFQSRQIDKLRAHLEEQGHLLASVPLEPLALRGQVLGRVTDLLAAHGEGGGVLSLGEVQERIDQLGALLA